MTHSLPPNYFTAPIYYVPIRALLIPYICGAIERFVTESLWLNDADYEEAYRAIAELQIAMAAIENADPNEVLAGPTSGTIAAPATLRLLVDADIPGLPASKITTGILPMERGGTAAAMIPSFSGWIINALTVTPNTFTKIVVNNATRNIGPHFNTANGRFTPLVSGVYLFTAYAVFLGPVQDQTGFGLYIYKNGVRSMVIENLVRASGTLDTPVQLSGLIYANGTTDYFELWTFQTQSINASVWQGAGSFNGVRIAP